MFYGLPFAHVSSWKAYVLPWRPLFGNLPLNGQWGVWLSQQLHLSLELNFSSTCWEGSDIQKINSSNTSYSLHVLSATKIKRSTNSRKRPENKSGLECEKSINFFTTCKFSVYLSERIFKLFHPFILRLFIQMCPLHVTLLLVTIKGDQ